VTYRKYRTGRRWKRALVFLALSAAAVVGVGAGARAQQERGEPEPEEPAVLRVAEGVTVGDTDLSGLTLAEAEATLAAAFSRPLVLRHARWAWRFAPQTLGASADAAATAEAALTAPPGSVLEAGVRIDERALRSWTKVFARDFDRRPQDAEVVLRRYRPWVTKPQTGRRLRRLATRTMITQALRANEREPLALAVAARPPRVTRPQIGPVVVIRRDLNRLFLYRGMTRTGMRLVRKFGVATGQASYPTPLGEFTIATKQLNPWWYPPDSDWAAGAAPVPPGPGNPLGTRWMGLSEPLIGIHGTPDAASIGYSASHGCVRMQIPEAEWLFERVKVGTRVLILAA
jgi:lipoprotein-anchoring transpeptidase ErfK/SrfK